MHDAGAYGGQFVKVLQTACMNRDVHIRVYEMIYRMLGKQSIKDFIYEHIKQDCIQESEMHITN